MTKEKDSSSVLQANSYGLYQQEIMHRWMRTLAFLGILLVPLFFVLDTFVIPANLLPLFGFYRGFATAVAILQVIILSFTRPSRWTLLHGYVFSFVVGGVISLMTTQLGGFNSPYYAGINLVLMGANLLLPWHWVHAALNSLIVLGSYLLANTLMPSVEVVEIRDIINNIYFLSATAFISVAINFVKGRLIRDEFGARSNLKIARDALWSEMAVAKQIQTALLPDLNQIPGFEIAAIMRPADEVGGDYYDVIQTTSGEAWVSIGDVSGHGVESGLVMMMTQTSIYTTIDQEPGLQPSAVLARVNRVIKKNMSRMDSTRYMTITLMRLDQESLSFAGKHQDLLLFRAQSGEVEIIDTPGTWLGIIDDVAGHLPDSQLVMHPDDVLLLYTDGVTELCNAEGQMFGDERLVQALKNHGRQPPAALIAALEKEVLGYLHQQQDDITLVALKRK